MNQLSSVGLALSLLSGTQAQEVRPVTEIPKKVQEILSAPSPFMQQLPTKIQKKVFFMKKDLTLVEKWDLTSTEWFSFVVKIGWSVNGKTGYPIRILLKLIGSNDIRTYNVWSHEELMNVLREAVK